MSKEELTKIVVITLVTLICKDVLSWVVREIKTVAVPLARITGRWMETHFLAIDFAVDVGFCIWWGGLEIVFWFNCGILLFFSAQSYGTFRAYRRWIYGTVA